MGSRFFIITCFIVIIFTFLHLVQYSRLRKLKEEYLNVRYMLADGTHCVGFTEQTNFVKSGYDTITPITTNGVNDCGKQCNESTAVCEGFVYNFIENKCYLQDNLTGSRQPNVNTNLKFYVKDGKTFGDNTPTDLYDLATFNPFDSENFLMLKFQSTGEPMLGDISPSYESVGTTSQIFFANTQNNLLYKNNLKFNNVKIRKVNERCVTISIVSSGQTYTCNSTPTTLDLTNVNQWLYLHKNGKISYFVNPSIVLYNNTKIYKILNAANFVLTNPLARLNETVSIQADSFYTISHIDDTTVDIVSNTNIKDVIDSPLFITNASIPSNVLTPRILKTLSISTNNTALAYIVNFNDNKLNFYKSSDGSKLSSFLGNNILTTSIRQQVVLDNYKFCGCYQYNPGSLPLTRKTNTVSLDVCISSNSNVLALQNYISASKKSDCLFGETVSSQNIAISSNTDKCISVDNKYYGSNSNILSIYTKQDSNCPQIFIQDTCTITDTRPECQYKVKVFENSSYGGKQWAINDPNDTERSNVGIEWDEKISSIKVKDGYKFSAWKNSNFSGDSNYFTDQNSNLLSWSDQISSYKISTIATKPTDCVVADQRGECTGFATVYTGSNFTGTSNIITKDLEKNDLSTIAGFDWNDKITSIKVKEGYQFCGWTSNNFLGSSNCWTSNIHYLPVEFRTKISSWKVTNQDFESMYEFCGCYKYINNPPLVSFSTTASNFSNCAKENPNTNFLGMEYYTTKTPSGTCWFGSDISPDMNDIGVYRQADKLFSDGIGPSCCGDALTEPIETNSYILHGWKPMSIYRKKTAPGSCPDMRNISKNYTVPLHFQNIPVYIKSNYSNLKSNFTWYIVPYSQPDRLEKLYRIHLSSSDTYSVLNKSRATNEVGYNYASYTDNQYVDIKDSVFRFEEIKNLPSLSWYIYLLDTNLYLRKGPLDTLSGAVFEPVQIGSGKLRTTNNFQFQLAHVFPSESIINIVVRISFVNSGSTSRFIKFRDGFNVILKQPVSGVNNFSIQDVANTQEKIIDPTTMTMTNVPLSQRLDDNNLLQIISTQDNGATRWMFSKQREGNFTILTNSVTTRDAFVSPQDSNDFKSSSLYIEPVSFVVSAEFLNTKIFIMGFTFPENFIVNINPDTYLIIEEYEDGYRIRASQLINNQIVYMTYTGANNKIDSSSRYPISGGRDIFIFESVGLGWLIKSKVLGKYLIPGARYGTSYVATDLTETNFTSAVWGRIQRQIRPT